LRTKSGRIRGGGTGCGLTASSFLATTTVNSEGREVLNRCSTRSGLSSIMSANRSVVRQPKRRVTGSNRSITGASHFFSLRK
jgi:hypothetical protein